METIAIIGIGTITKGVIHNLFQSGKVKLLLFSRHLKDYQNIKVFNNIYDLTDEEIHIVITCFSNDEDAENFWGDPNSKKLLGNGRVVIDLTTSAIQNIHKRKNYIEEHDTAFVECPVTGSKNGSESGALSLFVHYSSLSESQQLTVNEILNIFAKKIYFFENSTAPTKFKLMYNAWGAAILLTLKTFNPANFEFQVNDLALAYEIIENDGWMAGVCQSKLAKIINEEFDDVHFKLELMNKDLLYARNSLGGLSKDSLFKLVLEQYSSLTKDDYLKTKDFSIIARNKEKR